MTDQETMRDGGSAALVRLPRGWYLGGVTGTMPTTEEGLDLVISSDGVGLGDAAPRTAVVPWRYVVSAVLDDRDVERSRLLPVLFFGVLGLAGRRFDRCTYLTLHLTSGETAVFMVRDVDPVTARAQLGRALRTLGVPVGGAEDESSIEAPTAEADLALLERLAELHRRGVLDDDEFRQKKAEILGRL